MNVSTILIGIVSTIILIILFIAFKVWQLSTMDFGYVTKGNEAYYYDMSKIEYLRVHKTKLENVDLSTLKEIENLYAADANQVYCEGHILVGANPKTIEKMDYALYRDGNTVYYMHVKVSDDFPNFKHDGIYSWDHSKVFYATNELKEADAKSFESLDDVMMFFAKDKDHIYFRGAILEAAHSPSFEKLGNVYWKDKNAVYYGEEKIPQADPTTFKLVDEDKDGNIIAKDKRHTYINGTISD